MTRRVMNHYLFKHLLLVLLAAVLPLAAQAQNQIAPYLELNPTSGDLDTAFILEVHVPIGKENPAIGLPSFAHSAEFDFRRIGSERIRQDINGEVTEERLFTYKILPTDALAPGTYSIPRISVPVGGKTFTLEAPAIKISSKEAITSTQPQSDSGISFAHSVDQAEPYIGQQLVYSTDVMTSVAFARASLNDISLPDFARESFGKFQEQRRDIGDSVRHTVKEALFPLRGGEISIPERELSAEVRVARPDLRPRRPRNPWSILDDMIPDIDPLMPHTIIKRTFVAPTITLKVKPLPAPVTPIEGNIPVGELTMNSQVDESSVEEGGSITLTVEIISDGNLKPYELPKPIGPAAKDFKIYVDKPKVVETPSQNKVLFKKTFAVTLVPQKAGTLLLPAYPITYFNPKQERYITVQTIAETIKVAPNKNSQKLTVAGGEQTVEETVETNKQEIRPVGEDLLPQHVGAELAKSSPHLPSYLAEILIAALPMLALFYNARTKKLRLAISDPNVARARGAYRLASAALDRSEAVSADELLSIIRGYVGAKCKASSESLTSADVGRLLRDESVEDEAITPAVKLLNALQAAVYGGSVQTDRDSSKSDLALLRQETKQVIDRIEESFNEQN